MVLPGVHSDPAKTGLAPRPLSKVLKDNKLGPSLALFRKCLIGNVLVEARIFGTNSGTTCPKVEGRSTMAAGKKVSPGMRAGIMAAIKAEPAKPYRVIGVEFGLSEWFVCQLAIANGLRRPRGGVRVKPEPKGA